MRGRRGPHSRRSSGGNGAAGVTGWGAPVSAGAGRRGAGRGWAGWRLSEPPAGGLGKGSGPPPSSPSAALLPSPVGEEAREIIPTLGFSLKPSIGDVRSRSPRSWDFCRGFLANWGRGEMNRDNRGLCREGCGLASGCRCGAFPGRAFLWILLGEFFYLALYFTP